MGLAREAARRGAKDYMLGYELPRLYKRTASAKPLANPPMALFANIKQQVIPDAFKLIMPHLENNYHMDVRFVGINQAGTSFASYHARCREFVQLAAEATYIFLEDASDVISCLPLRPETKVIQLWHACGAFKKWGRSTAAKRFGPSAAQIERHPFYGNLSLVTVSAPEVVWAYREAMGLDDLGASHYAGKTAPEHKTSHPIVRALGVSRTDILFDQKFRANARSRLLASHSQVGARKVLLYAPTFRGPVKGAYGPDALDIEAMRDALGQGWALAIRHHPFVKQPPPIPPDCRDFAFFADPSLAIDELMCAADALVTDYSSVVFEYSLLNRPMLFFAPDFDDYCDWRGFYYDYDEMTPGPVCHTTGDLLDMISRIPDWFDGTDTSTFRDKFMAACDGHATERICREVVRDSAAFVNGNLRHDAKASDLLHDKEEL